MKLRSMLIFSALGLFQTAAMAANTVWLEAERFDRPGGWTNDAQFVDQMGSPYLLCIGLEGPVDDAVTEAEIPQAGKYRLWVRSRDWVPELSPGRFEVVLGGSTVDRVFGQSKQKGWAWEDGGVHELRAGKLGVRLHDLTGHYGRCDALVLSDDLGYRPPDDLDELAAERERHGGVSRTPKRFAAYDTVVVGGGLAGTMAAVASARMGCRTALIQDRPVLGGNASEEILVNPEGDTTREPLDPGEGGIIEEFRGPVDGYSQRMLALVESESGIDLHLNTHATGVEKTGQRTIAAVEALEVTTGRRLVFPGRMFVDCTGDGAIGVWAGAEYRHGREPASMYDETRAPQEADSHTMGGTLRYKTERAAEPVEFKAPDWARKFRQPSDFGPGRYPQLQFGGWQWVIEYGGMLNTYDDAEEIRDELLRIIWGMWDYAKNYSPKFKDEAPYYRLVWVSHVVGKRESRRLIGDYVMTEHDINPARLFEDRVSYGGWGVDLHPPGGFYADDPPASFSHKVKFSVPLRSLYSKDLDNLMMAGRCISVSHAALGATRVMITCGLQGQAVGTAAGICRQRDATPRLVATNYIGELQQQLLKDGCYLIDLPNRDPGDLARTATATASSEAPDRSYQREGQLPVHPLNFDRAVMFRVTGDRIDKVSLYLHSASPARTELALRLCKARRLGDFATGEELATATATVPPVYAGWIDFRFETPLRPGYYFAWLPKTEDVSWSLFPSQPAETSRAYRAPDGWKPMPGCYRFRLAPAADQPAPPAEEPEKGLFAAGNVINGYARAVRGIPNSWRPDPEKPLPQWVELDFGGPVGFNCVHVSFQSGAMRAEDFRIEVPDGDGWRSVAELSGNPQRRRVIRLPQTTAARMRLVITKARAEAGVCEIRVYDEPAAAAAGGP